MWHFPLLSQFDPDNTGYISTEKFRSLLQRHGSELDPHKLEVLLALADSNSEGRICYQDFVNLVSALAGRACQSLALLITWAVEGQCLSLSFPPSTNTSVCSITFCMDLLKHSVATECFSKSQIGSDFSRETNLHGKELWEL